MWIEAIVNEEDLRAVFATLLPLKIHLDEDPKTDRWIELGKAEKIDLVANEGLILVCPAELQWSIVGIDVPIRINLLSVRLLPMIIEKKRGEILAFRIQLSEADVAGLPSLIDASIVKAVNAALASKELAWDFGETLSQRLPMPAILEPISTINLKSQWGKVRVSDEAMVLALSLDVSFTRRD